MDIFYNSMGIPDIGSFGTLRNRRVNNSQNVCFVRCTGCNDSYLEDIIRLDRTLSSDKNYLYLRTDNLPVLKNPDDISYYNDKYNVWKKRLNGAVLRDVHDYSVNMEFIQALDRVYNVFRQCSLNYSETIEKNMIMNLIYRSDELISGMFGKDKFCKFVYYGKTGIKEYLFLYLATLMGIDTMILLPDGDIDICGQLKEKSCCLKIGSSAEIKIPACNYSEYREIPQQNTDLIRPERSERQNSKIDLTYPKHQENSGNNKSEHNKKIDLTYPERPKNQKKINQEYTTEEIAKLAESVVMIKVHDVNGKVIETGSGIAVNDGNYILTDCYIASRGFLYTIVMENEEKFCHTYQLIKYNHVTNLALIKIDTTLSPLKICRDYDSLARGQKVVSIGSPMGLFNTVSDGIISGFRVINDIDMIQFTAPVSKGNSGGAVLNMKGELIGVSTAGLFGGQNLNFAISCKHIMTFINGFLEN